MRIFRLIILAGCLLAACDLKEKRDDNPAVLAWEELSTSMPARVSSLRQRQVIVGQRIGALGVPPGTEDAGLLATIEELKGAQGTVDDAVARAEAAASQAAADAQAALGGKDKIAATRAVAAGRATFETAAAAADAALADVEPKLNVAEQIVKRLLAQIQAEVDRLRRIAEAGGTAEFSAIEFQAGGAQLDFTRPASKATLDRLVAFAGTCETLTFALTGHTSAEGEAARNKALSLARADAVKAYLVAAGVPAAKVVRTTGVGSTAPIAPEPAPGSPEEAASDPTALETLRRRNRRVQVEVVTPCAAPTAAAPPGPPPAEVDPHAGHNH